MLRIDKLDSQTDHAVNRRDSPGEKRFCVPYVAAELGEVFSTMDEEFVTKIPKMYRVVKLRKSPGMSHNGCKH